MRIKSGNLQTVSLGPRGATLASLCLRTRTPCWIVGLFSLLALLSHAAAPLLKVEQRLPGEIRLSWPGDATGFVLEESVAIANPTVWSRVQRDPVASGNEWSVTVTPASRILFYRLRLIQSARAARVASTSPAEGESGVAVTRETIVRLTDPLSPAATLTTTGFTAELGARKILSRAVISSDRRTLTLFYLEPLPSGARIRVTLNGAGLKDDNGRDLDADGDGEPGGRLALTFETLSLAAVAQTSVSGRVFASHLMPSPGGGNAFVNIPLGGVTITVDGKEESMRTVTDRFGNFRLEPVPAGDFFVHIDGRTVTNLVEGLRYPDLAYYPNVGKKWTSLAGGETMLGEIYLPLIPAETLQPVSSERATVLAFKPEFVAANPQFAGVSITVPAGALYRDDGLRGGMVGIAPVPPDRLPGPLPEGLPIQDVITIQTDGGSNFDQPVPACFPNLPDPKTGEKLPPGAKSALWSFNHDTGRFEIVGAATVSNDGRLVCTDPGVGILAPGWHGTAPGSTATGGKVTSGRGSTTSKEPTTCQPSNPTDPVYLFSGEFYESVEDLRIPGRGMDFVWTRKYRSQIGPRTRQGIGWDHAYNILLKQEGTNMVVFDGDSRADTFHRSASGTYVSPGFFRELQRQSDGSWTLIFEDKREWRFRPLDRSAAPGAIESIVDRNRNTIAFRYDGQDRLSEIVDTLGRAIRLSYNALGYIESLTDFAGRSVRYSYYDSAESGGASGDLKSVSSPSVAGTPHGNDFPEGKTVSYTYSTGFSDERLNHNLLTITDGRRNNPNDPAFGEGPYLINIYSSATDPNDPDFDRVLRQVWGGDVLDMTYVPLLPSNANGGAQMLTIVNDRNGNVKEYYYDAGNRMIRSREYTGRADPTQRTTLFANRPSGKLRSADPDYFETIYEWDDDSLLKRTVHPNGNITENTYEKEINPSASARSRGNLRVVRRLPGSHTPVGDQDVIEESYEYDSGFDGGCCGFNFVTRRTDGRNHTITRSYDAHGNLVREQDRIAEVVTEHEYNEFGQETVTIHPGNGEGHRRRDERRYYADGPQNGYLERVTVDAGGLALETRYEYDAVGNTIRILDPRGHDTRYVVNSLNQIVRGISREVRDGSRVRYQKDYYYDANNNVTRIDVPNVNHAGEVQSNSHYSTRFDYDVLNYLTRVRTEVDATTEIVEEYVLDANRNLIRKRNGEASRGGQPSNIIDYVYDERDLIYRVVRAREDAAQSSVQFDYDGNKNRVRLQIGLEAGPRVTEFAFDGYDRQLSSRDPMGNISSQRFDPNGNVTTERVDGELVDAPGGEANRRLSSLSRQYDAMNRMIREERDLFDPSTQAPLGKGKSVTRIDYSPSSQVLAMTDDNGHVSRSRYDTAHRLLMTTDAAGNTRTFLRDRNGNVTNLVDKEVSSVDPDETYSTRMEYDNLDRMILRTDSAGNTVNFGYDSRDNIERESDSLRSGIVADGNVTVYVRDGLNRLVETRQTLTSDGTGSGSVVGTLIRRQTWDHSTRLISRTDAGGNQTEFGYDPVGRRTTVRLPDGTQLRAVYDAYHDNRETTDANGTITRRFYDLNGRLQGVSASPGAGISASSAVETFAYDGLSRLVMAKNEAATVTRAYNSLSHLVSETQNDFTLRSEFDGMGNRVACVYPGGRSLRITFDPLDRIDAISEDRGLIARNTYTGPRRLVRRELGNSATSIMAYDGARRIVRSTHRAGAGLVFDDRTYAWDPMYRKVEHNDATPGGLGRQLGYDSAHRLVRSMVRSAALELGRTEYRLDAAGNRISVNGGIIPGDYTASPITPDPSDAQVNQYSTTPFDARSYDAVGNLVSTRAVSGETTTLTHDFKNRLVGYSNSLTGVSATYSFDALGRRIARVIATRDKTEASRYLYDGWRICEERDSNGLVLASFVFGQAMDEVLSMRRSGRDYYYHTDDLRSVRRITDDSGKVVESYDYDDFGLSIATGPAGETRDLSAVGNPFRFQGRELDLESGLYHFRVRTYDPSVGRFLERDPVTDPRNLGNLYAFAGNSPWTGIDPFGTEGESGGEFDPIAAGRQAANSGEWSYKKAGQDEGQPPPGPSDIELYYRGQLPLDDVRNSNCYGFVQYMLVKSGIPPKPRPVPTHTVTIGGKQQVMDTTEVSTAIRLGAKPGDAKYRSAEARQSIREWIADYAGYYEVAPPGYTPTAGDIVIWFNYTGQFDELEKMHIAMFAENGNILHNNSGSGTAESGSMRMLGYDLNYKTRITYRYIGHRDGGPKIRGRRSDGDCGMPRPFLDSSGVAPVYGNQ